MKKKVILLALIILIAAIPANVFAEKPITIRVNGEVIQPDVEPFIQDDRTYVPVRFVAEALGMDVDWGFSPVTEGLEVYLTAPNGREILINDMNVFCSDGLAYNNIGIENYILKNDRTFLPIRFVANALHLKTGWDQETRTVYLDTDNGPSVYPLSFRVTNPYNYEEMIEVPSDLTIQYRDGHYYLHDMDITPGEYMNFIYTDEFDQWMMEEGYGYLDIWENPFAFFGNNYLMMNPEGTKVVGIAAS